ncbi:LysR family transcriptional regulator [Senegalimassilia faecalis]|uniref:LysR family transcriptional regulator n=1 Tax=Senegalimassilia faecalis TaxID=2509433 RepID=UPI0030774372
MDSEKCRALVTAVELGSMSAAAQQLGYTASGITRMINALEAELGITLIARTSRGVALTSDGVALEPFLRELALTAERARQQAAAAKGLLEGEISVASYSSTAATWLPNILRAFQSSHPGVRMRTMEAGNEQLVSWVEQHTIDCAIFAKRPFRGDRIPLRQDPLPAATPHTAWWKRGWASASTTS